MRSGGTGQDSQGVKKVQSRSVGETPPDCSSAEFSGVAEVAGTASATGAALAMTMCGLAIRNASRHTRARDGVDLRVLVMGAFTASLS